VALLGVAGSGTTLGGEAGDGGGGHGAEAGRDLDLPGVRMFVA
jgi:hypothetical protein